MFAALLRTVRWSVFGERVSSAVNDLAAGGRTDISSVVQLALFNFGGFNE
jgi:hypothetical protein